jgi:hypothetical protein
MGLREWVIEILIITNGGASLCDEDHVVLRYGLPARSACGSSP